MNKMYIDVEPSRTQVVITRDGEFSEYYIEPATADKLVGNIYKGKVVNILQGMKAAFVNMGLERNGFLDVGNILLDKTVLSDEEAGKLNRFDIKEDDEVMCQIVKEPFGTKGPRITLNISIPGRFIVFSPVLDYVGISRKIEDEEIKSRLTKLVEDNKKGSFGYIIRTAAACACEDEIVAEMRLLEKEWEKIKENFVSSEPCKIIYNDGDLVKRTLRDMLTLDINEIITNDEKLYDILSSDALYKRYKTELYSGEEDLIYFYGFTPKIENLLKRKVQLKNGANIVIEKTEALTVIDVNTGKFVGSDDFQKTIMDTNLIAAEEIARQIKLRNIGGIIIVDFIDMENEENKSELLKTLEKAFKNDKQKAAVVGITGLGLVEITRKKSRGSINSQLLQNCPYCHGDGYVQSGEFVIMKLRQAIEKLVAEADPPALVVRVHPTVFSKIFAQRYLEKDSAGPWKKIRIYIIPDESLHIEDFFVQVERNIVLDLPNSAKMLY